ncbi:MAG: hypothetical protein KTR31_13990 [Myxococcales bacterium]|nr:hypothetical protein [Myxococcales bacterium]
MLAHPPLLVLLVACGGPDLAKLEVEQQALEREVGVLRTDVQSMREQMQAMGMLPEGPANGAVAGPSAGLDGQLTFTATREGPLPALPSLPEPQRRSGTKCGWRFFAPWLDQVSDISLDRTGSGKSSPILLLQAGEELTAHANLPKFERSCSGAFRVQPRYIFFSPFDDEDAVSGPWTLALDDAVPLARGGDGQGMYWVFPGTTLTFTFDGDWVPEWGAFGVTVDARLLTVGTPEQPQRAPTAMAQLEVLGKRKSGRENRLGLVLETDPPTEAWTVRVESPADGPWVLLQTLWVGNEEQALVVAGERG